jgi:hypothetical protein
VVLTAVKYEEYYLLGYIAVFTDTAKKENIASIFKSDISLQATLFDYSSNLMMEEAYCSEMLANFYWTTRRYTSKKGLFILRYFPSIC